MSSATRPLLEFDPDSNVTSFDYRALNLSKSKSQSLTRRNTPHITLHQFRKLQQSPTLSSSPDLDHKRVRRKQSSSNLSGHPRDLDHWPLPDTSPPSLRSTSPQSFSSSSPPPLPLTPLFVAGPTSPSLSSTVDTLPSTPPHTPIQHSELPVGRWRDLQRVELSEPIRTKRKFQHLRVAKRLPHHTACKFEGEEIWEVHAAVLDIDDIEADEAGEQHDFHVTAPISSLLPSTSKDERSVRFQEEPHRNALQPSNIGSASEEDPSHTSSFSLSKFRFLAPPGHNWVGTFGHLDEKSAPNTPTTPTTLHYKGASFDVVNPHASLLLGNSDFETPAEIDGLLDDYFNRSTYSTVMPSGDPSGLRSTSQYSLQTTSSNGRSRILHPDLETAHRHILNLSATSSQQTVVYSPYIDVPPLPHNDGEQINQTTPSNTWPYGSIPRHPSRRDDGFEVAPSNMHFREGTVPTTGPSEAVGQLRQSQVSDQFDLDTAFGDDNDDNAVAAGLDSYYDGEGHGMGSAVNEGDDNTQATQNTQGEGSTAVAEWIDTYRNRPSQTDSTDDIGTAGADATASSRVTETGHGQASYTSLRLSEHQAGFGPPPPSWMVPPTGEPPSTLPPTPLVFATRGQPPLSYSESSQSGPRTSDRTYGQTGILLGMSSEQTPGLTPEGASRQQNLLRDRHGGRRHHDYSGHYLETHNFGGYSTERLQHSPDSWSEGPSRRPTVVEPLPLSNLEASGLVLDDGDRESEWEDIEDLERSDASYANTSYYGTIGRPSTSMPPDHNNLQRPPTLQWPLTSSSPNPGSRLSSRFTIGSTIRQRPQRGTATGGRPTQDQPYEDALVLLGGLARDMSSQIQMSPDTTGRRRSRRRADYERLEHHRIHNPEAFAQAVRALGLSQDPRSGFSPDREERSFLKKVVEGVHEFANKAMKKLSRNKANDNALSDTESLLEEQRTSQFMIHGALQSSDTLRGLHTSPQTPTSCIRPSATASPISTPQSVFLRPTQTTFCGPPLTPTPRTRRIEAIELESLQGQTVRRAAMNSQRAIRPLTLVDSTTSTQTGRLTDAQLVAAAPGWNTRPISQVNRPSRAITSCGVEQPDGSIEHVSLLMNAEEGRNASVRRRQMQLTRPYFFGCRFFPVTAALFGLGAFDFRMKSMTKGVIDEMAPAAKKAALIVYLPLGVIAYAAFGLMVALVVVALFK